MTDAQLQAAATIQAIAEELRDTAEHWPPTHLRRQGRRLLGALDQLTEDGTFCPDPPLAPDAS
jgi:hypothetical protein